MSDKDSSQQRQGMDWGWIIATALILGLAHAAAQFAKPAHVAQKLNSAPSQSTVALGTADPEMREVQVDPVEVPHPIGAED